MALDQHNRSLQVAGALVHLLEGASPEGAFLVITARIGKEDRQRDLAVAEVVADAFTEFGLTRGKVEHIVDQLEGDPKIATKPIERFLFVARPLGDNSTDSARGRKELCRLGLNHSEIGVLGRL